MMRLTSIRAGTRRGRGTIVRAFRASLLLAIACSSACAGPGDDRDPAQPPQAAPAGERFVAAGDGAVRDTRTNLEWTSHDTGRDLPWHEAERYCATLAVAGRTGWRLPDLDELKGIYDEAATQPCTAERTCRLDPAIRLTAPYVWSATQNGPRSRFYVDFRFGTSLAPVVKPTLVRRTLCVRGAVP
jgi:hypothetical protein